MNARSGGGGSMISVGKLTGYTAAAGIDPRRVIPVSLDVGTNNEALLNDPLYLGNRHARVRSADYDAFIKKYLQTASPRFPKALAFGRPKGTRVLAALGVAAVVWGWGVAQYLVPLPGTSVTR